MRPPWETDKEAIWLAHCQIRTRIRLIRAAQAKEAGAGNGKMGLGGAKQLLAIG
jgi:hypothetical protein